MAIYARDFPPSDLTLKILRQNRFQKNLATLFYQGDLQLSLQTENGFFISTLPPAFENSELIFESGLLVLKAPNALAVYTLLGERVLLENTLSCLIETGKLTATLPLSDSLGRVANCEWEMSEQGLTRTKCILSQARTANDEKDVERIQTELLPFAFFESILLDANYLSFLSDDLESQAEKLKEYLGEFCAVTLTNNPNVCGLVYKKAERLFEIINYAVSIENDKITDIRK